MIIAVPVGHVGNLKRHFTGFQAADPKYCALGVNQGNRTKHYFITGVRQGKEQGTSSRGVTRGVKDLLQQLPWDDNNKERH